MNTQQDNEVEQVSDAQKTISSVGNVLREAREKLGLSVNDVANRIKFAPKQIEWLEADDFDRLPEAAFVRGFVRSYARLLELDPAGLISSLPTTHMQSASSHEMQSVEIPLPSALNGRRYNIMLLVAALIIALSLAIFERMHNRAPVQVEQVGKTTVQVIDLPLDVVSGESSPVAAQSLTEALVVQRPSKVAPVPAPVQHEVAKTVSAPPVAVVQKAAEQKPVVQAVVPAAPAVTKQPQASTETSSAEHSVRLEFEENAWVEIRDASDVVLMSRMHKAGSLVRVTGKSPMLVIIGNARAVKLFDNGKQVNLERYTTADVARVKLK